MATPLPDDRLRRDQCRPVRARVRRVDGAARGPDAGRPVRPGRRHLRERCGRAAIAVGRQARPSPLVFRRGVAADRFVFALGPWLPKLFPDVIGGRILPTRQEVFFFAPPAGDRRFLPAAMPAGPTSTAATSSTASPISKAAGQVRPRPARRSGRSGHAGPPPTEAALAEIIAFRDRRFPLLRGAPLTEARVCQYENSSNGDFLIDRPPAARQCAAGRRRVRPRLQARARGRPLRRRGYRSGRRSRIQPRQQRRESPQGSRIGIVSPDLTRDCMTRTNGVSSDFPG